MDRATRRQALIGQLRSALNAMTDPRRSEIDGDIEFDIAETTFNFTHEDLEELD